MKKGWKIFWIVIVCMILFGIGCLAAAGAFGFSIYKYTVSSEDMKIETDDWDEDRENFVTAEDGNMLYFSDISELKLDLKACKAIVITDEDEGVRIDLSEVSGVYEDAVTIRESDGELHIEVAQGDQEIGGFIRVYIPIGQELDAVEIDADASDVEVNGMYADSMALDVAASSFVIRNMEVKELHTELNAGSLQMQGNVNGYAYLNCAAGDLLLELDDDEQSFDYRIDCKMGNVKINNDDYGGFVSKHHSNHHADRTMEIECKTGSVRVVFGE